MPRHEGLAADPTPYGIATALHTFASDRCRSPCLLKSLYTNSNKEMEKLKIAICGGGITSLCLAYALTASDERWAVKIFEASSVYREESAAIGLGCNGQQAVALISPSLRTALDEAGGVRMDPSARVLMASVLP